MRQRNSDKSSMSKRNCGSECPSLRIHDSTVNARISSSVAIVRDIDAMTVREFMKAREHTGKPRVVIRNGAWTSGCTSERPKGWEQMRGVKEVEAV